MTPPTRVPPAPASWLNRSGLTQRLSRACRSRPGWGGTGAQRSPAARASTAWVSRRTGEPPGSSRSGSPPATGGPGTSLGRAVAGHFGVATVSEVAIGLHKGTLAEDALGGLAPVVMATAGEGDAVAARLVHRQADEVCAMALTAMRRLDLTGLATPVVLGGGLMAARDPLLMSRITSGIASEAPRATVRIVDIPPVAGAALRG